MFSRSVARPASGARTALLVEGTLIAPQGADVDGDMRKTRVVGEHSSNVPQMSIFDGEAEKLPVEPDRDTLELDGMDLRHPDELNRVLIACPNLTVLSIRRCQVSDVALMMIPKVCSAYSFVLGALVDDFTIYKFVCSYAHC
jgi:hypothetical protein